MALFLGHLEDGRGLWEREGSSAELWNECVPEKTTRGAKAVCLCMIQPFIISVFQNLGSGCFFRSPAFFSESGGKFCRIEVRHFFPPKGGSRYIVPFSSMFYTCNLLMLTFFSCFKQNCFFRSGTNIFAWRRFSRFQFFFSISPRLNEPWLSLPSSNIFVWTKVCAASLFIFYHIVDRSRE